MSTKRHDWTIDYRGTFRNRGRCLKCGWVSTMGTIAYARDQAISHQETSDEAELFPVTDSDGNS